MKESEWKTLKLNSFDQAPLYCKGFMGFVFACLL